MAGCITPTAFINIRLETTLIPASVLAYDGEQLANLRHGIDLASRNGGGVGFLLFANAGNRIDFTDRY
jgi:hypothetical protein